MEDAGRVLPFDGWFDAGDNLFRPVDHITNTFEERFAYADQSFIEMLDMPMVYGRKEHALSEPFSILISKRKADKYWPNEDPVGKTVLLNDNSEKPYVIGGVMENPENVHYMDIDFFITLTDLEFWPGEQTNWCCWNYSPYVLLKEGADPKAFEAKLELIRDDYMIKYLIDNGDQAVDNTRKYHSLEIQAVEDIYLYSEGIYDFFKVGDIRIVWMFIAVGSFILILACINFINLSTAKSSNRAKEVGLRKTIGSYKRDLVHQFLTESIVFCAISVIIGVVLAWVAMPAFNSISGKELVFPISEWWLMPSLLIVTVVIGTVAGLYPSFYLSAFKPIEVIRGSGTGRGKSSILRSGLVVFQFSTSIILIVGAMVVFNQLQFILNERLGYDKEQVLLIKGVNTIGDQRASFKEELKNLSDVESVSLSSYLPIEGTQRNGNQFYLDGRVKLDIGVGGQFWRVDEDYIETLGINLIAGRMFRDELASDSSAIVINETMARELGILDDPLGKKIFNFRPWNVVGVVEDFYFDNVKVDLRGLAMVRSQFGTIMSVKIKSDDMKAFLASITDLWDEFMPNQPIRYSFMDESYAMMYEDVKRTGNLFSTFAFLGVVVACLGLFGLSAFMVEQRSKEISIRKVLGASGKTIFSLLTSHFLKLVLFSMIFAIPISWYMMQEWLADFKTAIDLSWWMFALASLLALMIALVTISSESIKAAFVNPAKGLRSE